MSVKNLFRPFYNCCKIIKFSKNNKVTTGCRFSRETVLEGCNIIKKSDFKFKIFKIRFLFYIIYTVVHIFLFFQIIF